MALEAYQHARKGRAEQVQQSSRLNSVALHLPDGPEQLRRDEMFRLAMQGNSSNPDQWADEKTRKFLWDYDAERSAVEKWEGMLLINGPETDCRCEALLIPKQCRVPPE